MLFLSLQIVISIFHKKFIQLNIYIYINHYDVFKRFSYKEYFRLCLLIHPNKV